MGFAVFVFVGKIVQIFGQALAGAVGEFVARDAKKPGADIFYRLHIHQLTELKPNILQHVLCIGVVGHPLSDETKEALAVATHDL